MSLSGRAVAETVAGTVRGRECKVLAEQRSLCGTPESPKKESSSKATDRPLVIASGHALVIRPGKGWVPPWALSLCIQGPFFSGKQATFITSDSRALMQSRLEP